jgi:hypothetical protein
VRLPRLGLVLTHGAQAMADLLHGCDACVNRAPA